MPRSVTPESLRAEADALDAEIERLREEAADLRRLADRMEQRATGAVPLKSLLSSDVDKRSFSVSMNQDVSPITPRRDRRGRPITSDHPFPRAVEASGSSVQEWAKKKGLNVKSVRAWYSADKEAGRRIPRAYAELIEREFQTGPIQVPATQATWIHGIR